MSNLLIDIGNSEIKIGEGNSKIYSVRLLKKSSYSKNNFKKDFKLIIENVFVKNAFDKAGISILKDGNEKFLNNYFIKNFNIKPVFINRNLKLPVKINYSKGIGNDRICNALAANEIYKSKNILVIDFGTATTYTLISNKILIGGMISPGIKTSLNSLIKNTSLPNVKLNFPKKIINNTTINNIKAGVLYQSLFSVEKVISELIKTKAGLFVIATGGYSNLISKKTNLINKVDKNLVLKGINIFLSQ
ncbi:MAG: type III pantothenate kinase [Bacteroidota bacterium]|nr:type III pantothenate kinase [Bacteroidota bacterium]